MSGPDPAARYHKHFVCSCPYGDYRKNADELYQKALDQLAAGSKELLPLHGERDFVTNAITSLNWDYGISITGIPADMWFAIKARGPEYRARPSREPITYWIECDRVEDGLAYLLVEAPKDPLEYGEEE